MSHQTNVQNSKDAGPVSATEPNAAPIPIATDSLGIETGDTHVSTASGNLPIYFALPAGEGVFPIVIVIHEIFGVHEYIRDIARRFAKQGYFALAPDLFFRHEKPKVGDVPGALRDVVAKIPDAQVLADIDRTIDFAVEHRGQAERIAITGFCWGGRITWLYAAHNAQLKAAAAWYGRLVGEPTGNAPRFPIDIARELKVPVLGLYGGADQGIPLDSVARMQRALAEGGSRSEFVIYNDAPHAFHADYRPNYRPEAASDGWQRLLAWFKDHGV